MSKYLRSTCHDAPIKVITKEEGLQTTTSYECEKCGKETGAHFGGTAAEAKKHNEESA